MQCLLLLKALVDNAARDESHLGALLRIPTGVQEMQGLAHVSFPVPKLVILIMEMTACLMVETIKLSEIEED